MQQTVQGHTHMFYTYVQTSYVIEIEEQEGPGSKLCWNKWFFIWKKIKLKDINKKGKT